MARLQSRLLVPTVLRPFGEHLAAIVEPQPGDVCVDVGHQESVMAPLLARLARECIAVDDPDGLLRLPDGSAQVVTSLFALAEQRDPAAVLGEMMRILDPQHGRLAVALWSEPAAVPHLDALTPANPQSVEEATRFGFPLAADHLAEQAGAADRLQVSRIHDVVRFDGTAHWWAAVGALADERHRAECQLRLQPYTAADGTLRIPTEAVVLTINS